MKLTMEEISRSTDPRVVQEGRRQYERARIKIEFEDEDEIDGMVNNWDVEITREPNGKLSSWCECNAWNHMCIHAAALMLAVENRNAKQLALKQLNSWEAYLHNLPALPKITPVHKAGKYWKPVFHLKLESQNWFLKGRRAYVKKDGTLGQHSYIHFDYSDNPNVEMTPSEIQAIQVLRRHALAGNDYYWQNTSDFKLHYGEPVGPLFDLLADSEIKLEGIEDLPVRLTVYPEPATFAFQIDRTGGNSGEYRLIPRLQLKDHIAILDKSFVILTSSPVWLLRNRTLVKVENAPPASYLLPFAREENTGVLIPEQKLPEFLNQFIPHLRKNIPLELPPELSLQTLNKLTGRRLYLHDHADTIRIQLKFLYGEVEIEPSAETILTSSNGTTVNRVIRDVTGEQADCQLLLNSSLQREESGSFYVPKKHPIDWLLVDLPALALQGFEIFGEQQLQTRINRGTPSLNLQVSSGIDWLDMKVEMDFGGTLLALHELRHAIRQKSRFVKLADGSLALLPDEWRKRFEHLFEFGEVRNGNLYAPSLHALLIDALFDEIAAKNYDGNFQQRLNRLNHFQGAKDVPVPENFHGVLRPYQQEGLHWLGFLQEIGMNGCLADDMGLGKTIQTLAFLLREKNNAETPRTNFIVAPLSVLFNWEMESSQFAPSLKIFLHHGPERPESTDEFGEYDIVLTTYATMRNDIQLLKDFAFHYVILDESQNIKNPISLTAKAASVLQSRHRLVLTGTPLENTTLDLWSQFSFLNPGMLGNKTHFATRFAFPIERNRNETAAALLRKIVSPFLLRRTKEEVARELPAKSEQIYYCAMTPQQERTYGLVRDRYRAQVLDLLAQPGGKDIRFRILEGLTRLRQVACHPALIAQGQKQESGKFEACLDLVREIVKEDHKVLVFSQFVSMLNIIALQLQTEGISFQMLTGATRDRKSKVQQFQEDEKVRVFLISLKAGGLGLNLTAADYVILYDPWWNPAAERQAIDRAHRIGQNKNVFVYKMITRGTVEEKILELQNRKSGLVSQLITTEGGLFRQLTANDIRELFS